MIDIRRARLHAVVITAWVLALAAVLLWPLTRRGYPLGHDLVFTPRQPLDLSTVGLGSSAPRAVPLDALVALAERVVDGAVVARFALVLPVVVAGVAMAWLLRGVNLPGKVAACSFAVWNPYVIERMALGQWALLWCYAALPVVVYAAGRGRGLRGTAVLTVALAAASITPTGGVIAAVVALVVALAVRRRGRRLLAVAGPAVLAQLPWVLPSFLGAAAATSDPRGVEAFAARGEFGGGPIASLLGGGGIWDAQVVPDSRTGLLPWVALAVLAVAAWYGWARLVRVLDRPLVRALTVTAGLGLLVAVLTSLPGGAALLRAAVAHVPGAGLLRDAQKWVLPLVVLQALLAGAAMDRLAERVRTVNWRAVLTVGAAVVPVLLLPDATSVVHRTVEPVHYPRDWRVVAERLHGAGSAVVLPFSSYRTFPWARGKPSVLDPAPRLLPVPTVVQDRLAVSGTLLTGEDRLAARVARALQAPAGLPAALAAAGQRWVVVERDTPGRVPALTGFDRVYLGRSLALYRVPGTVDVARVSTWRVVLVIGADVVAGAVVAGAVGCFAAGPVLASRRRRRRQVFSAR